MPERTCSIEGCDSPSFSRGWCRKHYAHWYKAQQPDCAVEGCTKPGVARGWCGAHYSRWYKHGDPLVVKHRHDGRVDKGCMIDGCEAKHYAIGLCKPHYRQQPDQRKRAKQYERDRRENNPVRRESERQRTQRRRSYINAWLRHREQNMVIVETVVPQEIFERDGYRCQLCRKKTRGKHPTPTSPTLDHIIPVSLGGEHSYRNVQTACLLCNTRKGNRAANEQLRLLGR
jgi:5-methylcytosine-specific restriction endonuclease McrA